MAAKADTPKLSIDSKNNVLVEGVKICRIDPWRQTLYFFDKNKKRSEARGSNQVPVAIRDLVKLTET